MNQFPLHIPQLAARPIRYHLPTPSFNPSPVFMHINGKMNRQRLVCSPGNSFFAQERQLLLHKTERATGTVGLSFYSKGTLQTNFVSGGNAHIRQSDLTKIVIFITTILRESANPVANKLLKWSTRTTFRATDYNGPLPIWPSLPKAWPTFDYQVIKISPVLSVAQSNK